MKNFKMKCPSGDEPRIIVTQEFIDKNNLSIDINKALEVSKENHWLSFNIEVSSYFLPLNLAKHLYKTEYVESIESGEQEHHQITDINEATQDFLDYMVFAWMKAKDERGISTSRSIIKLSSWMRILGRDDISAILNDDSLYNPYGRPALKEACNMLGIKTPKDL